MFSSNTSQVSNDAVFVEDVFSTYLYTGNGSTQTITNGIDLSTYGGLVWIKNRTGANDHSLEDTARVGTYAYTLASNTTAAQSSGDITGFTASGFSLRDYTGGANSSGYNYASWTFRKQPKFFDVVTYTGTGSATTIAHNLGSVPGCIIVKQTSGTENWRVYHVSTGNGQSLYLNTTDQALGTSVWNSTTPTSTVFSVSGSPAVNGSGSTYVAYLFAHNAGGFGLTGTDNVISCGSYTGTGSVGPSVNLGYEPQWLLIKRATGTSAISGWYLLDNMRGIPLSGGSNYLRADTSDAETNNTYAYATPTATGFNVDPGGIGLTGVNYSGETYIYIAIRRGPMKVPTSGTSVFNPYTATLSAGTAVNAGLTPDFLFGKYRSSSGTDNPRWVDRLRGFANATSGTNPELYSNNANAETSSTAWSYNWNNTGYVIGNALNGLSSVIYAIGRAPSFFDEVCYTGTGSARTINHNLGVAPELMIVKCRSGVLDWTTYQAPLGASQVMRLNSTIAAFTDASVWNGTAPTSSVFSVGTSIRSNSGGDTFVWYGFASCPGVSKVGSYTGTGATQTISCGFTGGARFVLIKRTDSTGDWYYWDTARGMVAGTDPYLLMNSNVGETNTNSIYTTTGGFQIVSTAAGINASGGTYIYLAIA